MLATYLSIRTISLSSSLACLSTSSSIRGTLGSLPVERHEDGEFYGPGPPLSRSTHSRHPESVNYICRLNSCGATRVFVAAVKSDKRPLDCLLSRFTVRDLDSCQRSRFLVSKVHNRVLWQHPLLGTRKSIVRFGQLHAWSRWLLDHLCRHDGI